MRGMIALGILAALLDAGAIAFIIGRRKVAGAALAPSSTSLAGDTSQTAWLNRIGALGQTPATPATPADVDDFLDAYDALAS